jgi:hypothetical protein
MAGMSYEQLMSMQDSGGEDVGGETERGMTFEELQAQSRPGPSSLAKGFGNAAMLADMALNLPSYVLGIGANIGARVAGMISGGDRRENAQSAQRIQQEAQDLASSAGLIRDPAKKLMSALGYGESYDTGAVGGAMEMVSKGVSKVGEAVEKGTRGALLKEDVEDIVGEAMTLGGPHVIYNGGKALLKKAADRSRGTEPPTTQPPGPDTPPRQPTPDNPLREPPYTRTPTAGRMAAQMDEPDFSAQRQAAAEAPYRAETQPEMRSPEFDRTANLQQQAYDLMQSGASLRKVENVLKSKSKADRAIMEAAMEELRVRRASAGEAFNRAQQGEVLDPVAGDQTTPDFGRPEATALPAGRPPINQRGAIDQDLLQKMGLGAAAATAGLYAYARPDQQEEIGAAAAAIGGVLAARGKLPAEILRGMPERALGPVLAEGKYTLKTLDRLPQNRTEFSPAQVRQELNKPGTAAGEKAVLEPILAKAEAEGRKISADELVSEFRRETGDHSLTPKSTDQNADYGFSRLRDFGPDVVPTTTLWRFPETMHVSTMNHFGDPQYFGHTRSFREGGVEHVMELQSDLAQQVRKVMTPEERTAAAKRIAELESEPKRPRKDLTPEEKKEWQDLRMGLMKDDVSRVVKEGKGGSTPDSGYKPLTNVVKNAQNRLVRETLGQAAARGDTTVRFASPDTVAAVEGWKRSVAADRAERIAMLEQNGADPAFLEILKELQAAEGNKTYPRFEDPGHQSLYDRYAKETLPYLKSLGGKEITDAQGYTWLEVPTGATREGLAFGKAAERLQELREYVAEQKADLAAYQQDGARGLAARGLEEPNRFDPAQTQARIDKALQEERQIQENTDFKNTGPRLEEPRPFGGRPDSTGQGPIHMYGQADPRLLAGVAAAGLTAAGYFALPEEQREGVKDYLQAVGALGVVAGVTRKAGKGSLADVVRPAEGARGSITPDQAIKLGALASGAAVGGYLAGDERVAGAIIGGIGGLAATRLPALGRSIGKVLSPQQALGSAVRISAALGAGYYLGGKVDHPVEGAALAASLLLGRKFLKSNVARESDAAINTRNGNLKSWDRVRATTVANINKLVPDQARREAIAEAIQVGARNHLPANERVVYDTVKQMNDEIGKDAIDAKILRSLRENYITSIVEFAPGIKKTDQQAIIDRVFGRLDSDSGAGPGTRFAKARKYDTFSELNKAIEGTGLQIKTKDVGEIFNLYTKSMRKAIEDRILIDFHKAAKAVDGLPYIAKRDSYGRFPPGFRKIDHPQLDNVAVHPEAYDGMKVVLEHTNPDIVTAGLHSLSMAVKRSQVFGSLFHAKSLGEVYILAMGSSMLPRPGDLARPKRLIDSALKKFHEGGLGDEIDGLVKQGLQLEVPDDVSTTIIGDLGRLADNKFNTKIGTAVTDKIDFVNKKMDKITWDYMHAGVKSALALKAVSDFTINNAKLHATDPARYPLKSKAEIYAEASRFANDATGGLDWFRIATEAKTELGRSVAMHFASPQGRRMAQIIAFAPDWAISTLRAGFNSFGKSETGFRGLLKPTNAVDLYRQYALRSAALWITALNSLQYAMTGTPIWENKDPTRIEFKDGTSLQPAKHSAEAVHAVLDPVKFAMNKLGFLPSLAADIAAARHGAGFMAQSGDSVTWHTVKKALPFTVSPLVQPHLTPGQRVGRSVSGAMGVPIFGFNQQQKMMARRERMQEAARKQGDR